jgi:hypothetical protein
MLRLTETILALGLVSTACTQSKPAQPPDPRAERIASLAKMTERCGVPERTLILIATDEVTMHVDPDVEWGKVECLMYEIKKAEPKLQYMFAGNAPYETENRQ